MTKNPTNPVSAKAKSMAVLSLLSEQDSCENIAARYNVSPEQLMEWQKTFQAGGEASLDEAAFDPVAFPGSSMITSLTCLDSTTIRVQGNITTLANEDLIETYAYVYEGSVDPIGDEPPSGATTHGTNLSFDFNLTHNGAYGPKTVGVWAEFRQFAKSKGERSCGTTSGTSSTTSPMTSSTTTSSNSTTTISE